MVLFEKGLKESASVTPTPEGVAVIFDGSDGGIASATLDNIKKYVAGSLSGDPF